MISKVMTASAAALCTLVVSFAAPAAQAGEFKHQLLGHARLRLYDARAVQGVDGGPERHLRSRPLLQEPQGRARAGAKADGEAAGSALS